MSNPVESLLEHDHASLDQLLTELDSELAEQNHQRSFELLDLFWARLAVHIRAEHLHLFPALTKAASEFSEVSGPTFEEVKHTLARLRSDHDFFMKELADMMKEARVTGTSGAVAGDFRERLAAIRKRLEIHNYIEEHQVYVWPSLFVDESTVAALNQQLQKELENLPPRFAS